MNKIITDDYFPGKDCHCEARSSYECGCEGADWTPKEVYDLRGEVVALKAFAESTANLAKSLKAERDEAREHLDHVKEYGTEEIIPGTPHIWPETPHIWPGTPHIRPGTPHIRPGTPHIRPGTPHIRLAWQNWKCRRLLRKFLRVKGLLPI